MHEVLNSGKQSFKIEVPYKIIETGEKGPKPLILYLHGFNQNIASFEKECSQILKLNAYHLFVQGPYPLYDRTRTKNVSDWGRAWYLYDGNRGQFIKSLEISSQFLQDVVDRLLQHIDVNRMAVIGYSMGGYLAGYFSFTRWRHVNDLIVIGCRLKTEVIGDGWDHLKHLKILAIHGLQDESVSAKNQEKEIEHLKNHDIKAELKLLEEQHALSDVYFEEIMRWLIKNDFKKID
ncbi:MAG: alpha/beta hydrolase [Balneolaceae bacterium]